MSSPLDTGISTRPDVLLYALLELIFDGALIALVLTHPEYLKLLTASPYPMLQGVIFGAFLIGVLLTYRNFIRLFREERILFKALSMVGHGEDLIASLQSLPASSVKERLVGLILQPERAREGDPVGRDELEGQEAIRAGWGRYIAGVLTMMGLLGTFLGLMIAIESMRDLLALKDFDAFFSGVVGALDGMGTAFSTSLAGICGAVILGFQQLLIHHAQVSYLGRLELLVSRHVAPRLAPTAGPTGLEVELYRLREAFSQWRVDITSAGVEMQAAAEILARETTGLAKTSHAVLAILDEREEKWRRFEAALVSLQATADRENRMLLEMVKHQVGSDLGAPSTGRSAQDGAEAGVGEAGASASSEGGGAGDAVHEMRRMNDLLGAIHREMSLNLRMSANKLEQNQGELSRLIQRLLQRSESGAKNATHQILLLRNLIRYLSQDEARLDEILKTAAKNAEKLP